MNQFDQLGEDVFFELVRTMPGTTEAYQMLKSARSEYLRKRHQAEENNDGHEVNRCNRIMSHLNDEIKLLNKADDYRLLIEAVKEVFGQDGWEELRAFQRYAQTDIREAAGL